MQPFAGYKASQGNDGTLIVHNVPIFVECQRGEHDFSREWINAAVAKAKQGEAEGYLPPLHVRHHQSGNVDDGVRPAGYFRILGTGMLTFKGKPSMAVFADLHITDPSVKQEVLSKRLPYRSVEIFDVDSPALDSLALLDHEAPYLELPMLMVADIAESNAPVTASSGVASATFHNPWLQRRTNSTQPVVACFRRGSSAILLIEDDINMNKKNAKPAQFAADEQPEDKKKQDMAYDTQAPKQEDQMEAVKETAGEDTEKMAEAMIDVAAICDAIRAGKMSPEDLAAIQAAMSEASDGEAEEEAPAAPMGESMQAGKLGAQMARLAGENAALRARLDEREAAERRRDDVTLAMVKLEGRPLGSDLQERLALFHKNYGPEAFAEYVNSMADAFGDLDGLDTYGAQNFSQSKDYIPAVAMKWQKEGPDAVERAARFAREWKDLNNRGLTRQSEERYIELNMSRN